MLEGACVAGISRCANPTARRALSPYDSIKSCKLLRSLAVMGTTLPVCMDRNSDLPRFVFLSTSSESSTSRKMVEDLHPTYIRFVPKIGIWFSVPKYCARKQTCDELRPNVSTQMTCFLFKKTDLTGQRPERGQRSYQGMLKPPPACDILMT